MNERKEKKISCRERNLFPLYLHGRKSMQTNKNQEGSCLFHLFYLRKEMGNEVWRAVEDMIREKWQCTERVERWKSKGHDLLKEMKEALRHLISTVLFLEEKESSLRLWMTTHGMMGITTSLSLVIKSSCCQGQETSETMMKINTTRRGDCSLRYWDFFVVAIIAHHTSVK